MKKIILISLIIITLFCTYEVAYGMTYYENVDFAIINGGVDVVDHISGDINNNGKVDNKDLVALFQYLSNWAVSVNENALDINGDGLVNNKDLTRLFQYLTGWNVKIF